MTVCVSVLSDMKARVSVDYLPDGALPVYPAARWNLVIGDDGESIVAVTRPKKVIVPLFEMDGATRAEVDAKVTERAAALVAAARASMSHRGRLYILTAVRTEAVIAGDGGDVHLLVAGMAASPSRLRCPRETVLSSLVDFPDD